MKETITGYNRVKEMGNFPVSVTMTEKRLRMPAESKQMKGTPFISLWPSVISVGKAFNDEDD